MDFTLRRQFYLFLCQVYTSVHYGFDLLWNQNSLEGACGRPSSWSHKLHPTLLQVCLRKAQRSTAILSVILPCLGRPEHDGKPGVHRGA